MRSWRASRGFVLHRPAPLPLPIPMRSPHSDHTQYGDHMMKSDTQIQQDVVAELERDETLPAGSIGVEVHHGIVKLAGRISDAETKKRAALDARRVDGATGVILDMGIQRR